MAARRLKPGRGGGAEYHITALCPGTACPELVDVAGSRRRARRVKREAAESYPPGAVVGCYVFNERSKNS